MKRRTGTGRRDAGRCDVLDLMDRMEPDLKLLEGGLSRLRSLSDTSDAVEPIAPMSGASCRSPSSVRICWMPSLPVVSLHRSRPGI